MQKPINCEGFCSMRVSWSDALSEINSGCLAGADFLFVFRNADCKRVDVPPKLRLAIPRHLQLALAPRQPKSLLARGQRCGADRIVNAALRRTFAAGFRSHCAPRGEYWRWNFYGGERRAVVGLAV